MQGNLTVELELMWMQANLAALQQSVQLEKEQLQQERNNIAKEKEKLVQQKQRIQAEAKQLARQQAAFQMVFRVHKVHI